MHTALQRRPVTTATALGQATGLSAATVNKALALLMREGIVTELTERRRGRVFAYRAYVKGLDTGLDDDAQPARRPPRRLPTLR